jgi:epoxyqueuosine reductase
MTADPATPGCAAPGGGEALAHMCEQILSEFIADPSRNTMGPGTSEPAWEGFLLAFAAGDDPLFEELKIHAGSQHWTPAEAFAAAMRDGAIAASPGNLGAAAGAAGVSPGAPDAAPDELTVVSWALCQTEAAKAANRRETRMPSEPWARSRIFGQQGNVGLHLVMLEGLRARGYQAAAPSLLPAWAEAGPHTNGWSSTWSERHVAYVAGLGTFSLCGGLITERGQAVRLGSVVVKAVIPATLRAYDSPFAYCLHYTADGCDECVQRCPVGSVNARGRDKQACAKHLNPRTVEYVRTHYGFEGYGCGLCQTAVPCESAIPEGLRPVGC